MNDFFTSFASLFSIEGIVGFCLGVICEYVFLKLRCRHLDKTHPEEGHHTVKIKREYWVWALVLLVVGGLTFKAQETENRVTDLVKSTDECSRQFREALKAGAEIGKEEREINARWQDEQFDRAAKLNALLIKYGSTGAPGYIQERIPVDMDYFQRIDKIFADRNATFQARELLGGYPDPTCGRE